MIDNDKAFVPWSLYEIRTNTSRRSNHSCCKSLYIMKTNPQKHAFMGKGRLEAFSDAVLAIVITIMVLDLKVPHGADLHALGPMWSIFLCYVLSFIYLAIYWNNHHHMLYVTQHITGSILWANMHLLFWLSLVPFVTGWMGENHFAAAPTALYGVVLLMASFAYLILQHNIIAAHGPDSTLARAVGTDWKGKLSPVLYLLAIAAALIHPAISGALYSLVAFIWLIPDRRIERSMTQLNE
jgi:uncharacterized membrane protein